jgi:hypothetical protein
MDIDNLLDEEVIDFLKIDKDTLNKHTLTVEQRLQNFSYKYVQRLVKQTDIYKTMNEAIDNGNKALGKDLQLIDELGIYTMIMNVWGEQIIDELEKTKPDFQEILSKLSKIK